MIISTEKKNKKQNTIRNQVPGIRYCSITRLMGAMGALEIDVINKIAKKGSYCVVRLFHLFLQGAYLI